MHEYSKVFAENIVSFNDSKTENISNNVMNKEITIRYWTESSSRDNAYMWAL